VVLFRKRMKMRVLLEHREATIPSLKGLSARRKWRRRSKT
jgi:hypothetical protein